MPFCVVPKPRLSALLVCLPVLVAGCGGSSPEPKKPAALLLCDADRDGVAGASDRALDRLAWSDKSGAVFLANIDDDAQRCPKTAATDDALAACNDAADAVVNGDDDALDLAPLRISVSDAPAGSTVELEASPSTAPHLRFFVKRNGVFGEEGAAALSFSAEEAAAGVDVGVEGLDIVRDASVWDGFVDVSLTLKNAAAEVLHVDTVRMRVAPVFLSHHLQHAEKTFATKLPPAFDDGSSAAFCRDVTAASSAAGVSGGFQSITADEQWAQDFLDIGFATMPIAGAGAGAGAGATQHAMRVYIRSANYNIGTNGKVNVKYPLRVAGRAVFSQFRGKDVAGLQQYALGKNLDNDSYDSFGNTETIPPHTFAGKSYPLGRIVRGATATDFPEPSFTKMLESQGFQDPVYIDTSWLYVGHVDETVSFIKATGPRGWKVLLADTALGKKLLTDAVAAGAGSVAMFVGQDWFDDAGKAVPARTTISAVLADQDVMSMSANAAIAEEHQWEQLKAAAGLTADDMLRVPAIDQPVDGKAMAYVPGMVNGVYLSDTVFGAPEPHGPLVGGRDPFKEMFTSTLAAEGIRVTWIEDWNLYHAQAGEVHCGSNVQRAIPSFKWWEQAR